MDENKTYSMRSARLWKLFLSTLYISSFTFGGGFVIVTFMKKKFVDELHWIDEQEMLDMTALAQSSPGAIAVNAAILVGWQVEGLVGMLVAVLGTIIPPMVILSVVSVFYNAFASNHYIALLLKGMQAGVAAVILDVVFDLGSKVLKTRSWVYIALMAAAFIANTVLHVNVVLVILAAAAFGVVRALAQWKKAVQNDLRSAFSQLFAGRDVQCGRRLRRHSADPESGGGAARLADHAGVHRPCHDRGDDPRPHCGQRGDLCGTADRAGVRSHRRNAGLHHPGAVLCIAPVLHLPQIQGHFPAAKRSGLPASGHRGTYLWRRAFHPVDGGVLRRCKDPRPSGLGRHRQFCHGFFALRKLKWNPILTMCLCGVAGLGLHGLLGI